MLKLDPQPTKPDDLESSLQNSYTAWKSQPTPATSARFLATAEPVMRNALKTVGGDSPILRAEAKALTLQAIQKYNPRQKVPLRNWLMTSMQPLRRIALKEADPLPVSERLRQQLAHVQKVSRDILDETGQEPDDITLADRLKISPKRLQKIRGYGSRAIPESSFESDTGEIDMPGVQKVDQGELYLDYLQHDLDPVNRRILEMSRAGIPKHEIAVRLKLSPSAITQRSQTISKKLEEFYKPYVKMAGRDFSCLMIKLSQPLADEIKKWHARFPNEYVYSSDDSSKGIETEPHITVKYGLHTECPEEIQKAIDDFGPIRFQLGDIAKLSPQDEEYDVLVIEAHGDDLFRLNAHITDKFEATDKYPKYRPHVTLVYAKRGTGDEFVGDDTFDGLKDETSTFLFTTPKDEKFEVKSAWLLG